MCFRLLAAIASRVDAGDFAPAPLDWLRALTSMGERHGLDLKLDASSSTALLSVCGAHLSSPCGTLLNGLRKRVESPAQAMG